MAIERIALATRKGLLIFFRQGNGWQRGSEFFSGSHVSYVFLDDRSGNLFACLDDGHFGNKLFRWSGFATDSNWQSADQAEAWEEISVPKYPDGAKLPNGNDAVLKYQWGMAAGSDDQPGRVYIGTEPGGLFVSDDHGDNFDLVDSLWNHPSRTAEGMGWFGGGRDNAGIHSICVSPVNADHLRVGISCAGVFVSENGGSDWRPTNHGMSAEFLPDPQAEVGHDPHLLVQSPSNPNVLWNQNHCGVYRSEDGGENWTDISDKSAGVWFGFAIAIDPEDENVAWVVPAEADMVRSAIDRKLCVCRTDDGGKSWKVFRNGLPQENCYDFAFRHNLIFADGDLVFGTACGSLYLSADRGEHWDTLAQHLPPIYCVAAV